MSEEDVENPTDLNEEFQLDETAVLSFGDNPEIASESVNVKGIEVVRDKFQMVGEARHADVIVLQSVWERRWALTHDCSAERSDRRSHDI